MCNIIFRAKTMQGIWTYGYFFKIWDKCYTLWGITNDIPNMIEVDPETVSQYTEVDTNDDRKIFENDILKDIVTKEIFQVVWCNHQWQLCKNEYEYIGFCEIFSFADFEIIGNIFDNENLESEV